MTVLDRDPTLTTLRRAVPGLTVGRVLCRGAKAVLVEATFDGRPVVAKVLTSTDRTWREALAREARIYLAFQEWAAPVAVPGLVAQDVGHRVLVIGHVGGRPVHVERHPPRLPPAVWWTVLAAAVRISRWMPPVSRVERVFDYPARITRYHGLGLLTGQDVDALRTLLPLAGGRWEFAHGDLLLSNVHLPTAAPVAPVDPRASRGSRVPDEHDETGEVHGPVTVLDWEWAGMYLPGWDLATLWLLAGATPGARGLIVATAGSDPAREAAFWVNAATAVTREIHTHAGLPGTPAVRERLNALHADRRQVGETLGRLAATAR